MRRTLAPKPDDDRVLIALVRAIAADEQNVIVTLLTADPSLALQSLAAGATRANAAEHYIEDVEHYLYEGDTALHAAAAAYRRDAALRLLAKGADVMARNRRGAQPLHYAADGGPTLRTWDPRAQAETVACLLQAGADPNAFDKSGVAPIHRAVRTRSTGAVRELLGGGADPRLKNKAGSTPLDLASMTTGRSGSGTPAAKREQEAIIRLLEEAPVRLSTRASRRPN
jgi:hypothetical protein